MGHGEQKTARLYAVLERPSNEVRHVDPGYLTPATHRRKAKQRVPGHRPWASIRARRLGACLRLLLEKRDGALRNRGIACRPRLPIPCLILCSLPTLPAPSNPSHTVSSRPLSNPLCFLVSVALFCPITHTPSLSASIIPSFRTRRPYTILFVFAFLPDIREH